MQLSVMSQNVQAGAIDEGRWPAIVRLVRDVEPDILALQEVDWMADPGAAARAADELGMRLIVAPSHGLPVAVGWRPQEVGFALEGCDVRYSTRLHHGYCAPRFHVPGLGAPLVVAGVHLAPYSARAAAQEAELVVSRVHRHGGVGMMIGDVNHCPLGDPEPDWERAQVYNRMARCQRRHHPDQPWQADLGVAHTLTAGGLVDVAAMLADQRNDPALRAPTGKGGVRVDQIHVTAALQPAVTDYKLLDETESDHRGVYAVIDPHRTDHTKIREYT